LESPVHLLQLRGSLIVFCLLQEFMKLPNPIDLLYSVYNLGHMNLNMFVFRCGFYSLGNLGMYLWDSKSM
jgi:hypothetical protein